MVPLLRHSAPRRGPVPGMCNELGCFYWCLTLHQWVSWLDLYLSKREKGLPLSYDVCESDQRKPRPVMRHLLRWHGQQGDGTQAAGGHHRQPHFADVGTESRAIVSFDCSCEAQTHVGGS